MMPVRLDEIAEKRLNGSSWWTCSVKSGPTVKKVNRRVFNSSGSFPNFTDDYPQKTHLEINQIAEFAIWSRLLQEVNCSHEHGKSSSISRRQNMMKARKLILMTLMVLSFFAYFQSPLRGCWSTLIPKIVWAQTTADATWYFCTVKQRLTACHTFSRMHSEIHRKRTFNWQISSWLFGCC